MARHQWTLALIFICLPILATVITAFRVRDLPKTSHESVKKEQKCDDCEVKDGHKLYSTKIKSDEQVYQETKKVIKGKEQVINRKASEVKSAHRYQVKSDEDDDDNDELDLDIPDIKTGFSHEYSKASGVVSESVRSKKIWNLDDDDEGEVEDDERSTEEENVSEILKYYKIYDLKNKIDPKIQHPVSKRSKTKIDNKFKHVDKGTDDEDDDDDNDDPHSGIEETYDYDKNKSTQSKSTFPNLRKSYTKPTYNLEDKTKISQKSNNFDNEDNDDDDDDDDDVSEYKSETEEKNTINRIKSVPLDIKKPSIIKLKADIESKAARDVDNRIKNKHNSTEVKFQTEDTIRRSELKLKQSSSEVKGTGKSKLVLKREKYGERMDDQEEEKENEVPSKSPDMGSPKLQSEHLFTSQLSFTKDIKKQDLTPEQSNESHDIDTKNKKIDIISKSADSLTKKAEVGTKESNILLSNDNKEAEAEVMSGKDKAKPMTSTPTPVKEQKKTLKTVEDKKKSEPISTPKETNNDSAKLKISHEKADKTKKVDKKTIPETKRSEEKFYNNNKIVQSKKEAAIDLSNKRMEKRNKQHDKTSKKNLHASQEALTKSESHLNHVTEALHRRNLLKSEFEDFYAFFPTFAPNFSRIHNPECRRHGQIVLRQLRGTKLWALNMLDATAKIPSGILQGNGIQLGDFDQCLASRARVQLETGSVVKIQGKYCLARIDVKAEHPELELPVHLAQAKNLIRSRIDDPGHFVPRFSTLSWGVCMPTACNPEDVETVVRDAIKHYQHTSGVVVHVKVDEQDCHTEQGAEWWEDWLELPTLLTLSFYGIIILLVLVATIQDFVTRRTSEEIQNIDEAYDKAEGDQKETKIPRKEGVGSSKQSDGFVSAFSLYRTISKLVAPGTTDEIPCIHGVRAIATIALLVAHKFFPVAVMPFTNRLKITETVSSPLWSWCRAGWMFTDCFLLLSGTLTAHRICTDKESAALKRLFSRYLRLTPALVAVVLFYAYIWDNISSGPMWGTFVTKNAQVCQEGWWWNLLYVQNYFKFEDLCAPQTHQLALDMQLTILGGIIVWAMQVKQGISGLLLPIIHIVAAYSRYTTVRDHRLTLLAYHGVSVSQLYRTARLSYASTLHRSTPYLIGLSLGFALVKPHRHGKIVLTLGWIVSTTLWGLVWWAGFDSGSTQYRYNLTFASQYAALAPIASAIAIAWVIYAVNNGSSDFLSRLLCCRPLVFVSRLSYALYLCQFIVFITTVATVKTSSEFTLMSLVDVKEISAILLSSTILTLTFVIPMQSLPKIFSVSPKTHTSEANSNESQSEPKELNNIHKKEPKGIPQMRPRQHFMAHRELLEEIPEMEVEYEMQREKHDSLDEIMEEEENDEYIGEQEMHNHFENELEIIEEEGGEEEVWMDREYELRTYSREQLLQEDLDEWEWTANGRNGAAHYR